MSFLSSVSLIMYTALHTGLPCETVFTETALQMNPHSNIREERPYLDKLAKAACKTTNPDVIWQITNQETNFRFLIVRINNSKGGKILRGQKALSYLKRLKKMPPKTNVDIGPMQINWRWHKKEFNNDPLNMLNPAMQVKYLTNSFGPEIYNRCYENWIGCYHNPSNKERASGYQAKVLKKRQNFILGLLVYTKNRLNSVEPETRKRLPVIKKETFYAMLKHMKQMHLPGKNLPKSLSIGSLRDLDNRILEVRSQSWTVIDS